MTYHLRQAEVKRRRSLFAAWLIWSATVTALMVSYVYVTGWGLPWA